MSTAILIGLVFFVIYELAEINVNAHINEEIKIEQQKHLQDVSFDDNETYLIRVNQWKAREHNEADVNPVFIQFYDTNKELIDKSPNLKDNNLQLQPEATNNTFYDTTLSGKPIRQIQTTIKNNTTTIGYMVVAMSLSDADLLNVLKKILLISFPLIVIILFLLARFFAGRSIAPINTIINTTNSITKDNLQARIPLPQNKDELYLLSEKINSLLDRIESAIEREKQFTSDASHELRTPLAVIKGTLEVLVRKPRTTEEYNEKINFCVKEVDRLNYLVDQLLLLARFENNKQSIKNEEVFLEAQILDVISTFSTQLKEREIKLSTNLLSNATIQSDSYLISIILTNLISNAIKYSNPKGTITISLFTENNQLQLHISDDGIGISEANLAKIFDPFYRIQNTKTATIKGTGIGLSIVKRLCSLLHIKITISSTIAVGTTIKLIFNDTKSK
ncbi:sensor histidine kinase [Flavobacterium sp.]|uniref:sensor histidine kinase n=1 Tax=Flavobacterium sp. TaxID=239 RepID=UPI003527EC58